MLKTHAKDLFGSSSQLATAIGVSPARISQLPEQLPQAYEDRIVGAAIRCRISRTALKRAQEGTISPASSVNGTSKCA